jgi:hypothetical protein
VVWVGRSSAFGDFVTFGDPGVAIVDIGGRNRAFRVVRGTAVHGTSGVPELGIPVPGQRVWVSFDLAPDNELPLLARMIVVDP